MTVAYEGWARHALRVRDLKTGKIIHSPDTCPTCIEREEKRRNMITEADLDNWFTYHAPTAAQIPKYDAINAAAKAFAKVILANTPASADQSAAIRLVREARMTANAAIACAGADGGVPPPRTQSTIAPNVLETVAMALHEVNRAYCKVMLGDDSQKHWEDAPEWQKQSAHEGVMGLLVGKSPAESHEGWLAHKLRDGWKFGPVKDEARKEHPCMMPYNELPPAQQRKDAFFVGVGRTMLEVLGVR